MLTRLILMAMLMITTVITSGQMIYKDFLNQKEVDNLHKSLNKKTADTTRIDILLQLAEYHLRKWGNEQLDLDNAASYISKAKEINDRLLFRKRDGLILLYSSTHTRKSGNTDAARQLANKAIAQFQASGDGLHAAQAYLELSLCYNSNELPQAAVIKKLFNALFQHVPKLVAPAEQAVCMFELNSFYLLHMGGYNLVVKLDFLERLIRAYRILNDSVNVFWARKEVADIHYQQGSIDVAINELLQIAKEQKAGAHPRICFTYDLLASLYRANGNYDKALAYSLETIRNVSSALDSVYLSNFYSRVAGNYSLTGSIAEAAKWNIKRLDYLVTIHQTDGVYDVLNSVTRDLIQLGRPKEALSMILAKSKTIPPATNWEKRSMLLTLARCYKGVHENTMAAKYCGELIRFNEQRVKRKEITSDPNADQFLSQFYLDIGQYDKAEKYHLKVKEETPKTGRAPDVSFDVGFYFKLDSARGNYLAAIKNLQAFHAINDSIYNVAKSQQIEDLKIHYATAQKDSLIQLKEENIQLLTKQDLLQKNRLRQGARLRDISFAIVALLIIIMALLYNRYTIKQRTNKKLQVQQHEISRQNTALQQLVNEKDWLVKEIHHRVKNNLQTVTGLLGTQSGYLRNDIAINAITDSQRRIQAMSLIHQRLYQSNNLSATKMTDYIPELVSSLSDSFDAGNRIRFILQIGSIALDLAHCIPLGLILNEAITNSFKYAFPNDRQGTIHISLKETTEDHFLLTIQDNGIGLPSGFRFDRSDSMGMNLMRGLSEEIGAQFDLTGQNGTRIELRFAYIPESAIEVTNTYTATTHVS